MYWTMILDFKRDVRAYWVAKQKKTSKKNPARAALVEETTHIHSIAQSLRLLGPHWLAGSQQNDMLELLRHKVDSDPELAKKFRIQGVALVAKILEARKAGSETYKSSQSFRWIRDVADDLVRNEAALISTAHLGQINDEPHWIGLVFDFSQPTATIRYGDSFGELMLAPLSPHKHLERRFLILLNVPGFSFVDARLEAFNKIAKWTLERLEVARALATLEDESSDDRSDHFIATPVISSGRL
ncbi:hypothetical protein K438DRAFT_1969834 [Mycena galopus ATCC 62051]|nr:hypothetical protein K438DRAFT_1969834 [Mycena galopus ATCC 62051]